MLSPFLTVFVLAVLWLIVVVPMLFRRRDVQRRDRAVTGFGRAMRALGRRAEFADTRPDVFVPPDRDRGAARGRRAFDLAAAVAGPARRPVPAAEEALMYPVDPSQTPPMSEARAQMMARRRRSLSILGVGTAVFLGVALVLGGLMWLPGLGFSVGLIGYLWFLRTQALRDRDRRADRLHRSTLRRDEGRDLTDDVEAFEYSTETVVAIDDDDLELQNMDTIDLTGVYVEEAGAAGGDEADGSAVVVVERRAS